MNPFRYHITLRLHHPDMDPDLISSALEIEPYRKWRAGEPRMNPKGLLLGGINKTTYWCSEGVRGEGFDLAESLESQVQKLEENRPFLAEFCSSGGEVDFFVGWFTGERNTGEVFDWELLKRLAALRITLMFDVYGGKDPGERTPEGKDSDETSKP